MKNLKSQCIAFSVKYGIYFTLLLYFLYYVLNKDAKIWRKKIWFSFFRKIHIKQGVRAKRKEVLTKISYFTLLLPSFWNTYRFSVQFFLYKWLYMPGFFSLQRQEWWQTNKFICTTFSFFLDFMQVSYIFFCFFLMGWIIYRIVIHAF